MPIFLLFVASMSLVGCVHKTTHIQADILLQAQAPNVIDTQAHQPIKLPITLRLNNNSLNIIELVAANPCAVFRWKILDEHHKIIQSKPNQLCIQSLATSSVNPKAQLEKSYEIILNSNRYTAGSNYYLQYKFWKYAGTHRFTIGN